MVSIWFGEFVLPPTTIVQKHEEIGNALRSYDQLNKLVQAVGDRFPFLIVGGHGKPRATKPAVQYQMQLKLFRNLRNRFF